MTQNVYIPEKIARRGFLMGMLGGGAAYTGGLMFRPNTFVAHAQDGGANTGMVNVRDFGAIGNGETDDTAAIQLAIDSVAIQGGIVNIPAGVYLISAPIVVRSNVSVMGNGIGNSVLKVPDNHNGELFGILRTPFGESTVNVYIANLTLDGNRENQSGGEHFGFYCGVEPGNPASDFDIHVERVEAHHFTGYGFDPHEITTRLYLISCISHHNGLDGFTLDSVVDSVISGCISYENDRHGFNIVTDTRFCLFQNCVVHGNRQNGFTIQNGSHLNQISNNMIYGNHSDGIYMAGVVDNTIINNYVTENLAYGIRVRGCPRTSIVGNRLHSNSQRGNEQYNEIQLDDDGVTGSTQCMVANNHVTCSGDIRARFGINETPGTDEIAQSENAFMSNAVFGAVVSNYNIGGKDSQRQANV
ncbi:MAG: right-handed parallel beta-helix repeat-containing protein [Anaerolineae bacterium]|nr:right-handed parallel beta-helix repeat-containing protein [Anaerolineae bacterium]